MKHKKAFASLLLSIVSILCLTSCIKRKPIETTTTEKNNTDFTAVEKTSMQSRYGALIPFLQKHNYYLTDTFEENFTIHYIAESVTKDDFNSYIENFKDFELKGTRVDTSFLYQGDYYTYFNKEKNVYYDILLKPFGNSNSLNVYMYKKGDSNFIYDSYSNINHPTTNIGDTVSFKGKAYSSLKDISSTRYVCPSKGNVKILVVPVQFPNAKKTSGEKIIKQALTEQYNSLRKFYYTSSYGKLNLSFEIVDEWYMATNNHEYYGNTVDPNMLLEEILTHYDEKYDYSSFDS